MDDFSFECVELLIDFIFFPFYFLFESVDVSLFVFEELTELLGEKLNLF